MPLDPRFIGLNLAEVIRLSRVIKIHSTPSIEGEIKTLHTIKTNIALLSVCLKGQEYSSYHG
jgi:hypothetical protein